MNRLLVLTSVLLGGALAVPLHAQNAPVMAGMAGMDAPPVAAADPAAAAAPGGDKGGPKSGVLVATLSGANETAGGDPDGKGSFRAKADATSGEFCFSLTDSGLGDVTGAHVHEGAAGKDGKVLMTVYETDAGEEECLAPDPEMLGKILANPDKYYVNVHTSEFPKGAIRAQLSLGQ